MVAVDAACLAKQPAAAPRSAAMVTGANDGLSRGRRNIAGAALPTCSFPFGRSRPATGAANGVHYRVTGSTNQRLPAASTKTQTVGIVQITGCAVHNPDRLKIVPEEILSHDSPNHRGQGDKGTRGDRGTMDKETRKFFVPCPLAPLSPCLLISHSQLSTSRAGLFILSFKH